MCTGSSRQSRSWSGFSTPSLLLLHRSRGRSQVQFTRSCTTCDAAVRVAFSVAQRGIQHGAQTLTSCKRQTANRYCLLARTMSIHTYMQTYTNVHAHIKHVYIQQRLGTKHAMLPMYSTSIAYLKLYVYSHSISQL